MRNKFKNLLFLLFIGFGVNSNVKASDLPVDRTFVFIEDGTDVSKFSFVKTIKCNSRYTDHVIDFFNAIKNRAKDVGANSFKYISLVKNDTTKIITLTLDLYFATDYQLDEIIQQREINAVYIFSDDGRKNKRHIFSINEQKITIEENSFYKYVLKEGETIKINKGGFTGMSRWIKWENGKPATFVSLTGFKVVDGPPPVYRTMTGIWFTTGELCSVEYNLGKLLATIFKQSNP